MLKEECRLAVQGFLPGSCGTWYGKKRGLACITTLKWDNGRPYRLIKSAHLSRPEHYFSIYQSGCNWNCKKCHSWEFTQYMSGEWMSPDDILALARSYARQVTVKEPKERATAFHAHDLCRCCGTCVELFSLPSFETDQEKDKVYLRKTGRRSRFCPGKVKPEQIVFSSQGFGPARNIIAFTGGDLACQPEFYALCAEKIKEINLELWILFETNGYGLTPQNLDLFRRAGIDAYWLDIKAYDEEIHRRLTGATNQWVLRLPEEILRRDFTLEVLSLYIPGWVEEDQIGKIAALLAGVDKNIPFTILAFFPEYKMKDVPSPTYEQMILAYEAAKSAGLKNVRLGNLGVFVKTEQDYERLTTLAPDAW